jgi:hypothetical protein
MTVSTIATNITQAGTNRLNHFAAAKMTSTFGKVICILHSCGKRGGRDKDCKMLLGKVFCAEIVATHDLQKARRTRSRGQHGRTCCWIERCACTRLCEG